MDINLKQKDIEVKETLDVYKIIESKIFLDFEIINDYDIDIDIDQEEFLFKEESNTIFNKIFNYIRKTYTNIFIIIITGIVYFYYIYSYRKEKFNQF